MTINYNIYIWWAVTVILFLLIAFISKKAVLRYSRNENKDIKKSQIKKIKTLHKNIDYGVILFAILTLVLFTVFFGINITTIHRTVKEAAIPTIESPSAAQIDQSNQQLENEIIRKRSIKINASKQKTQDEYDQFLKDAVNQKSKEQ